MQPEIVTLVLLFTPLAAAAVIAFFLRRHGGLASALSVGAAAVICGLMFWLVIGQHYFESSVEFLKLGNFSIHLGFLFNDLSALMLFVVGFVGFLIHVFSLGYMSEDANKGRFFGAMSLFMFSMLGITLANDLIMLFIFWELVGLSSYLLISFYYDRPSAVAAGNKAFIVNRVGDFGFLLGIVAAYWTFGTINLSQIAAVVQHDPSKLSTTVALLIFCGAVGKSGQMPLHVWLPDAMEGPTPVSALIHAATMVAAGVFLLCRISVLMTHDALTVVLWVGTITAVYAGFCAITQRDIKKILAYSTVSQLGYMVAAFGLGSEISLAHSANHVVGAINGGVAAAMFHLTTHAFFKALLFLGAGSVIHACHHEQNIFNMGGLAKKMPVTFLTFTCGFLALIAFPGFSGFFSKDAILTVAIEYSKPAFYLLILGAFLTAFYMTRLWVIAFFGTPKTGRAESAHENGLVMTVPLILLAIGAVFGGLLHFYPQAMTGILSHVPEPESAAKTTISIFGVSAVMLGILSSAFLYRFGAHQDNLERKAPAVYGLLASKLYFDEIYNWYVAQVQQRFAQLLAFLEQVFISGLMVRGSAGLSGLAGIGFRSLYTGSINSYVYWFLVGVAIFWAIAFGNF